MNWIFYAGGVLSAAYVLLISQYRRGWIQTPEFLIPEDFQPSTLITVVIPARNEAANIESCVRSVLEQEYPTGIFNAIVVDDHSEDETAALVHAIGAPNLTCLSMADFPPPEGTVAFKKRALALGFEHAGASQLVVTTDADCIVKPDWLRTISAKYEAEAPVAIAGPVSFSTDGSSVQDFQSIDFLSMQGITVAAHRLGLGTMGNGANLVVSREAFYAVEGYSGVDSLASGDDYLLLHKLSQAFPGRIAVLKSANAIVTTAPQPDWRSFLRQRIRWASKSGKYPDHRLTAILLLVYLSNVSILSIFVFACFNPSYLIVFISLISLKAGVEYWFFKAVAGWFGRRYSFTRFLSLQPFHILYVVSAGLLGFFGTYTWKGRQVR